MTLGNRITTLRNTHHMSQGDLAERLNVSRQSVSKWETDTSVPDLDKLITLSEIFGITLDELVKGPQTEENVSNAKPEHTTETDPTTAGTTGTDCTYTAAGTTDTNYTHTAPAPAISDTQRTIGFILITVGLLGTVLGLVLTSNLLLLTLPLVLFGILCLTIKRHAGLVIGWIILIPGFFIIPYMFGFTPLSILHMFRHLGNDLSYAFTNVSVILALIYWICVLVMAILTWRAIHKKKHA